MGDSECLENFRAFVDEAFRGAALCLRQNKVAVIFSEAQKHFPKNDFRELQDYVFERLEK